MTSSVYIRIAYLNYDIGNEDTKYILQVILALLLIYPAVYDCS